MGHRSKPHFEVDADPSMMPFRFRFWSGHIQLGCTAGDSLFPDTGGHSAPDWWLGAVRSTQLYRLGDFEQIFAGFLPMLSAFMFISWFYYHNI